MSQELSENELLKQAQQKNQEAINLILHRYKGIVRKKARHLFIMGGDQDDLIQEGMIGLFKAIEGYDSSKGTEFSTFAETCISRQLYDAIRLSNRQKNIPLNTYISIYSSINPQDTGNRDGGFMVDRSLEALEMSPEEILIDRESAESLKDGINHRLSNMEQQIFEYYMDGMTYQEISHVLHKDPKSIDNALQRIKRKVNLVLEEVRHKV